MRDVMARMSRRGWFEIGAVLLTGVMHLAPLEDYFPEIWFIVTVAALWTAYIAWNVVRDAKGSGTILQKPKWSLTLLRWGFRTDGLWPSTLVAFAVGLFGLGCMALIVFCTPLRERAILWHPDMLWLLLFYPVWGLFQQFCVQALIAGNLGSGSFSAPFDERVPDPLSVHAARGSGTFSKKRKWSQTLAIALICGPLFGIVHAPNWPLVGCTAVMGFAFTFIYLRWRNLWPLGLVHGWMGVPTYFWLLGVNPLAMVLR